MSELLFGIVKESSNVERINMAQWIKRMNFNIKKFIWYLNI